MNLTIIVGFILRLKILTSLYELGHQVGYVIVPEVGKVVGHGEETTRALKTVPTYPLWL